MGTSSSDGEPGDLRSQSGCACALDGPADFAYAPEGTWWRDDKLPPYIGGLDLPAPSFVQTVNDVLDGLDSELRELSLKIHCKLALFPLASFDTHSTSAHPELGYKERSELCRLAEYDMLNFY